MLAAAEETQQVTAKRIILALRNQMALYTKHNLTPKFVLMSICDYNVLEHAKNSCDIYVNEDKDTVNGLPIVICEHIKQATVTTSPSDLIAHGLL